MKGRSKYRFGTVSGLVVVGLVFGFWAFVVGGSAAGWNWFHVDWDYERTGQLGDSFGVVSAVMTSLAAMFTYITMRDERDSNQRLRLSERRSENREKTRPQRRRSLDSWKRAGQLFKIFPSKMLME